MAAIGSIEPFDEVNGAWDVYAERLHAYLLVNGVAEEQLVNAFSAIVGGKTYGLLRSLLSPAKPSEKTLAEIMDVLGNHYSPRPVTICQRHRFRNRRQATGESVTEFMAALKTMTEHCDFGVGLNDQLRDQFVCGLLSDTIQRRLLTEEQLTREKALKIAVSMETAGRDINELHGRSKPEINKFTTSKTAKEKQNKHRFPKCKSCGKTNHQEGNCWFKNVDCHNCGKRGHTKAVCRQKGERRDKAPGSRVDWGRQGGNPNKPKVHHVSVAEDGDGEISEELPLYYVHENRGDLEDIIWVYPKVGNRDLKMELDTGSKLSIISTDDYEEKFRDFNLRRSDVVMKTYTGEMIHPKGILDVEVEYGKNKYELEMFVIDGTGPPLFGRSWLKKIQLDWPSIRQVTVVPSEAKSELQEILQSHGPIFNDGLGTVKNVKAVIEVEDGATPKFVKPRPVPYSLREKVDEEIDRLVKEKVIEPVDFSDWATPIVPVIKKNGSLRLCGDFKVTLNPVLKRVEYPLPRIEDLFANLAGGKKFSKIDLSNAYQQMLVDEKSKRLLVLSTQKGLFRFNRLPFGIATAPAIFQRTIDQILQGLPGVLCYMDDLLVTGKTSAEHLQNLERVLQRLEDWGVRVARHKCFFFKDSVEYLGHMIDESGLRASEDKVKAILQAPSPENVSQLRSFLGLLNYYNRFLPNQSTLLRPLNKLLGKGVTWQWSEDAQAAFDKAKILLSSTDVLVHYDPEQPVTLACDASPYGVGAVLSHITPDGERPIAYISRTLTKAEQNYAQIDKEALAIVFGVKKFYQYLIGKRFTLLTDHRPLTKIFGSKTGIPTLAAARLQRWALLLSAYDYDIVYRRGQDHGNADGFSRLPLPGDPKDCETSDAASVFNMSQIEKLPVQATQVASETRKDKVLSSVLDLTMVGWHRPVEGLQPFYIRRHELTVQQGCLMWGMRVVIPASLQQIVLQELHAGHQGCVKMKALARSYVWWSNIDEQIEQTAKSCEECARNQNLPPLSPLHPWQYPEGPWQRVHVDFAGPFEGKMFFILVDAFSKWPEVVVMGSTTALKTIEVLRGLFSRHGLPLQLVSDNGPQFVAEEFKIFMEGNGIQHITSAPYHPASNGLAERFVQTLKQGLRATQGDNSTLQHRLAVFLMTYRNTPHSTTKEAPALLLTGRRLRSRLDLLKPNLSKTVAKAQERQIQDRGNRRIRIEEFDVNQPVLARNYREGAKWVPGSVCERTGPVSYQVQVDPRTIWRRHADQLVARSIPTFTEDPVEPIPEVIASTVPPPYDMTNSTTVNSATDHELIRPTDSNSDSNDVSMRRYPARERHAPVRLNL